MLQLMYHPWILEIFLGTLQGWVAMSHTGRYVSQLDDERRSA